MAKSNAGIASAVLVIANNYFTRTPKKAATAYTVAPAGKVTVNGVKTGKMFTNTGNATLSFLNLKAMQEAPLRWGQDWGH